MNREKNLLQRRFIDKTLDHIGPIKIQDLSICDFEVKMIVSDWFDSAVDSSHFRELLGKTSIHRGC